MNIFSLVLSYLLIDAAASTVVLAILYFKRDIVRNRVRELLGINSLASRVETLGDAFDDSADQDYEQEESFL